jgi:two-component system, NarL family, nitrate/nitrite response regulator NarL
MTGNASFTQIVIATADPVSRGTLLAALHSDPGFTVVGEASDGDGLLTLRWQLQPDILILDSALAGLVNGDVSSWPGVRIILLATVIDEKNVKQALRLAARGLVPKTAPPRTLLKSIRSVLADQYWLGTESITILVQMLRDLLSIYEVESSQELRWLTAKEHAIIAMIAKGHSNREISQELSISERTVKHHLTSIFGKLGLSSRLQLAIFAATNGLVLNAGRASIGLTVRSDSAGCGQRKALSAASLRGSSR